MATCCCLPPASIAPVLVQSNHVKHKIAYHQCFDGHSCSSRGGALLVKRRSTREPEGIVVKVQTWGRFGKQQHVLQGGFSSRSKALQIVQQGGLEADAEDRQEWTANPKNLDERGEALNVQTSGRKCLECAVCAASRRRFVSAIGGAAIAGAASPAFFAEGVAISAEQATGSDYLSLRRRPAWQEELFANAMATTMQPYETQVASLKRTLFQKLSEGEGPLEVLELGMGTGPNLQLYARPQLHVTAVDPNAAMRPYAQAAAKEANLSPSQLSFLIGVGESLPLPENSVDVAVGTLVLCSVIDVEAVLREVLRVLKPGGQYLFLEHVAASDGTFLRALQGALDPLQQLLADGCHLTRDPLPLIQTVGFTHVDGRRLTIPQLSLLSPHVYGFAQK